MRNLDCEPKSIVGKAIVVTGFRYVSDWPEEDWCKGPNDWNSQPVEVFDNGDYIMESEEVLGTVVAYYNTTDMYHVVREGDVDWPRREHKVPGKVMRKKLKDGYHSRDTTGWPIGKDGFWWFDE